MRGPLVLLIMLVLGTTVHAAEFTTAVIAVVPGISDLRVVGATAIFNGPDGALYRVVAHDGRLASAFSRPQSSAIRRPNMLPDGQITFGAGTIRAAWLTNPTLRYAHGVLGDRIEAAGIAVETVDGATLTVELGDDSVFEDRYPRLADVDGDGADEVVSVRSYLGAGAAVVVFKVVDGALRNVGESPAIGLAHRWLNPVGVADFNGDGRPEIAVVITPHIGGVLTLYQLAGPRLRVVGEARGFSNHAMGSRALGMSVVADLNGDGVPDMVIPDSRRRVVRGVTFAGGKMTELFRQSHHARVVTDMVRVDADGDGVDEIIYGLADGTLVALRPRP